MRARGWIGALAAAGLGAAALGCASLLPWVAVPFLYREARLPAERTVLDVPYRMGREADPRKHRLDLFLPEGTGWPVLVFVHGGGWTSGDRTLRAGGADVYRNIGRFFAGQGVGVAVISYRLQPAVDWRAQVDDVASAVAWVHESIGAYGGNADALFLAGHSAGAHLASYVALDRERLAGLGVDPSSVCGLIPVSGAALDLEDAETWSLGADPGYYEVRFAGGDPAGAWRREGSAVGLVDADAPASLVLYAGGESEALKRQAHVLHAAYRAAGAPSELVEVPGEDHSRIVLTLSRDDRTAGPAILRFIRSARCGEHPATSTAGGS